MRIPVPTTIALGVSDGKGSYGKDLAMVRLRVRITGGPLVRQFELCLARRTRATARMHSLVQCSIVDVKVDQLPICVGGSVQ